MADTPEMFGPTRGVFGDGRFNGTMQNVVGPTLIAMATKLWLGAEIQTPTGLSCLIPTRVLDIKKIFIFLVLSHSSWSCNNSSWVCTITLDQRFQASLNRSGS